MRLDSDGWGAPPSLATRVVKTVRSILFLLLLFAAYIAVEIIGASRARPPASVQTLDDYLAWQTRNRRIELQQSNGQLFVVMQGPNAGLLPSGPPVYVFDATGRLIDWTADSGDDPLFQSKWFGPRDVREVSLEEARQRVAATQPAR